eukprot:Polyplicarium_translucidae@DN987_c0_g1_i1.p1
MQIAGVSPAPASATSPPATPLFNSIQLLIRDPECLSKTWTLDVDRQATVAELIKAFLLKRNGDTKNACQMRVTFGGTRLHDEPEKNMEQFGIARDRLLLFSSWKASAGECSATCASCRRILGTPPPQKFSSDAEKKKKATPKSSEKRSSTGTKRRDSAEPSSPVLGSINAPHHSGAASMIIHLEKLVASAGQATDVAGQLERLLKLHKSGALTEDEFQRAKQKVLDM